MKNKIARAAGILCLCVSLLACGGKDVDEGSVSQTQAQLSWQEQYDLGIRLLNEGNYEDAILAFQAALSIDPKNMEARVGLANAYQQLGQLELALQVLAEADAADGDLAGAYIQLAEQYFQAGEEDNALRVLQQAVDRLDGEDRDRVLDYAEKKGYVLDENGKLVAFDEEAYLATLTRDQLWRYYFAKGENGTHWMFGDSIQFGGRDVETLVLQDLEGIAATNGWKYTDLDYRDGSLYAWLKETEPYEIVFWAFPIGEESAQENAPLGFFELTDQTAVAEGASIGILDICRGDSLETVLTKLGWLYVEEICEILRDPQGTSIDLETYLASEDLDAAWLEVRSPLYDTLAPGEKSREAVSFSYVADEDSAYLEMVIQLWEKAEEEGSDRCYQSINFYFDGSTFALKSMNFIVE